MKNEEVIVEKSIRWNNVIVSTIVGIVVLTITIVGWWMIFNHPLPDTTILLSTNQVEQKSIRHTTDRYPPSVYFPKNLTPTHQTLEEDIKPLYPEDPRGITAEAYAVMDRDTGELLAGKNITKPLPIASVTKIMTALVALNSSERSKELIVSDSATKAGEAVMGLSKGEKVTVEELLYGLLLPSGNDAAETLAEGIYAKNPTSLDDDIDRNKSRTTFIANMNKTAEKIGMYDTFYANPSGLDEETEERSTHSTALDLLALGKYGLENETFAKITSTKEMIFPYKKDYHKAYYLYNILNFSRSFPGVRGIKPGNTDFAGETLASYAENGGKRIVLVLLKSQASKDDAVKLYTYIYKKLGIKVEKG